MTSKERKKEKDGTFNKMTLTGCTYSPVGTIYVGVISFFQNCLEGRIEGQAM